jgi:hypothetical protein
MPKHDKAYENKIIQQKQKLFIVSGREALAVETEAGTASPYGSGSGTTKAMQ